MMPLTDFHRSSCKVFNNRIPACKLAGNDGTVNFWQVPFKKTAENLRETLHEKLSSTECIIGCFWFCLIVAIVGFYEACSEFLRVYLIADYDPQTFWGRRYHHISKENRRMARLAGCVANIATCVFLIHGIVNVRASWMFPWVILNFSIVVLESTYFVKNVITNKAFLWEPFSSTLFLAVRCFIAYHLMIVIGKLESQNQQ